MEFSTSELVGPDELSSLLKEAFWKCRDSGSECLTVKCNPFGAGRLLKKKNGESFQIPWYFEVQKRNPITRNEKLKGWNKLIHEDVTIVSEKNFCRVSGQIGLSER